jgi:HlyD family secretion protein
VTNKGLAEQIIFSDTQIGVSESYILALVESMTEEIKNRVRTWIWWSLGLIAVIIFFATQRMLREKLPVRAEQIVHQALKSTVSTNGRVEPIEEMAFYSPSSTLIKTVYVHAGEQVPAGKVLILLDDVSARAKVATAESGVKSAQAGLDSVLHNGTLEQRQATGADLARAKIDRDQAQHDLRALEKLAATGAASSGELGTARQRLQSTEATLHAVEESAHQRYSSAEVARAKAAVADANANLAAAREMLSQTVIRAKTAGTVYSVAVHNGDYTEEGKVLLEMADLSREQVRAYFDEVDIGHLSVNQPILIKWDAKPGHEWHGRITRPPVSVTTYGTRNVGEVLISLDDANGTLLPDTNVNVTATTSTDPNALTIPRQAVYSEDGKPYVFKVVNGSLVRTPVTTGIATVSQIAILHGLSDGDLVAVGSTNGQPLSAGVAVKVIR